MSGWRKVEDSIDGPDKKASEMSNTNFGTINESISEPVPEAESITASETPNGEAQNEGREWEAGMGLSGQNMTAEWNERSSAWEISGGNAAVLSPRRYTAGGRRRGRHRFASLLGLIVLLLAAVGLVSLVIAGIHAIEKSQDDTALRSELSDFLNPVFQYNPSAFTNVNDSKQDALLLAAIYRVTEAERIRQLHENTSVCSYEIDDLGRMLIPVKEIEDSYKALFGPDAKIYNHTIGEEGLSFTFEYDSAKGYYHIPSVSASSMYMPVIDTLKKKGDTIIVRVGFVLGTKVGYDDKGNLITPTADMADYYQLYTVKRTGTSGSWMLVSVKDDGGKAAASTTAPADTTDTATGSATATTTAAKTTATKAAASTTKAAATAAAK